MATTDLPNYTKKDFATDQEIRWCPGCGDYAILNSLQSVFAGLKIPREKLVVVSGIGCSSRTPYYMETYGFHTVHGRAPAIATGLKLANPELAVWVVTGDGDALAIGASHFMHALRRNIDLKILLFNNRIYGLTKGQASPTSERGKKTPSSPLGTLDAPFSPVTLALAAGATFVARSVDRFPQHLQATLERAARHKGAALVEIFQNCNIFNDGAFSSVTEKDNRLEQALYLEHGQPLIFGKNKDRGIRLDAAGQVEQVNLVDAASGLLTHDETAPTSHAFLLAGLDHPFPVPLGVFRCVERPTYDSELWAQAGLAQRSKPDLGKLLTGVDTWTVGGA
jgi:2-oxoglutarate ferredoxin oxidoreductase subunit beta